MDWSIFASCFGVMTCVLSVERLADGRCGTVRIVTRGNFYRKYPELKRD